MSKNPLFMINSQKIKECSVNHPRLDKNWKNKKISKWSKERGPEVLSQARPNIKIISQ